MKGQEDPGFDGDDLLAGGERKPRGIQSIIIGFKILECLAEAPTPLGLKNLAQATHMPSSKLRFYLISFLELGLVYQDGASGRYGLGPAALRLGLAALEKIDVIHMVRGEMAELADQLGYTVFLCVWGTHGPTVVDRVDGRNRTVLEIRVGSVLPLLSSSAGRVFAAFMPKSATAAIGRREQKQAADQGDSSLISGPDVVIDIIRAERFARASGTLLTGFTAIASPILDRAGTPLAVVSVVGAVGKMPDSKEKPPGQALLELTTRLSRQIGWEADS